MPNALLQNPIIVTSATTSYKTALAAAGYGTLSVTRIKMLVWEGANPGDTLLIIDPANGATRFRMKCANANQDEIRDFTANPQLVSDFAVDQIDSGLLSIYLA